MHSPTASCLDYYLHKVEEAELDETFNQEISITLEMTITLKGLENIHP